MLSSRDLLPCSTRMPRWPRPSELAINRTVCRRICRDGVAYPGHCLWCVSAVCQIRRLLPLIRLTLRLCNERPLRSDSARPRKRCKAGCALPPLQPPSQASQVSDHEALWMLRDAQTRILRQASSVLFPCRLVGAYWLMRTAQLYANRPCYCSNGMLSDQTGQKCQRQGKSALLVFWRSRCWLL